VGLKQQIDQSSREVRRLKRYVPYIYPEYQALKHAERLYKEALDRLAAAREAWDRLGNP